MVGWLEGPDEGRRDGGVLGSIEDRPKGRFVGGIEGLDVGCNDGIALG